MYKISFCTTSKNRLHHLSKTLPKNLTDNEPFSDLEFVVLNYNSDDKLDDWVHDNFAHQVEAGRLAYYEMIEEYPGQYQYFNIAHAKNVSHRLALGDIVVNVDADNFTGEGFADWVNLLPWELDIIAVPMYIDVVREGIISNPRGVGGRICMSRFDFLKLGGYDETLGETWGMDDTDLVQRVTNAGLTHVEIPGRYLDAITHDDEERIANQPSSTNIDDRTTPQGLYALLWRHRGKRVNQGRFGCGMVRKNWTEEIELKPFPNIFVN